ncbi:MAG: hypothetical protein ACREF3_13945 [Acetobacteraceae bacterium]
MTRLAGATQELDQVPRRRQYGHLCNRGEAPKFFHGVSSASEGWFISDQQQNRKAWIVGGYRLEHVATILAFGVDGGQDGHWPQSIEDWAKVALTVHVLDFNAEEVAYLLDRIGEMASILHHDNGWRPIV